MNIQENISLRDLTTFKLGGLARYFVRVTSAEELQEAVFFTQEKHVPFVIIGEGSNVIIRDEGYPGVVIKMDLQNSAYQDHAEHVEVVVGAGVHWDSLVNETVAKGYGGIENLSGIPGTVGATPIQNVGAYGVEVKDVIVWVETFNTNTGTLEKRFAKDCHFAYRDSFFKTKEGRQHIVVSVCFTLAKHSRPNISYKDLKHYFNEKGIQRPSLSEVRKAVLAIRHTKFPDLTKIGTAGSFFKNPIISKNDYHQLSKEYPDMPSFPYGATSRKVSLAWILDHVCKLKGFASEHFALYEKQPLVIVHNGGGTIAELEMFVKEIEKKVFATTNIVIENEVTFL